MVLSILATMTASRKREGGAPLLGAFHNQLVVASGNELSVGVKGGGEVEVGATLNLPLY